MNEIVNSAKRLGAEEFRGVVIDRLIKEKKSLSFSEITRILEECSDNYGRDLVLENITELK